MNNTPEEISQSLQKKLDQNGFSYQYSIVKTAQSLFQNKKSKWYFFGSEMPVLVQNKVIHIDFVFKHSDYEIYLIGECKHSHPKHSNWSFVQAPYTFRDASANSLYFDFLMRDGADFSYYGCSQPFVDNYPYHLGFELKSNQTEDTPSKTGNSAINEALTQAFRSSSGFINFLFNPNKYKLLNPDTKLLFIPAVFTTANLWTSNANIATASVIDGFLPENTIKAEKKDWIWFNHNRSSDLMHSIDDHRPVSDIYNKISKEIIRSAAIVSSDGIKDFLSMEVEDWIRFYCVV